MRIGISSAVAIGSALILVTACSSGSQSSTVPGPEMTAPMSRSYSELVGTGIAPQLFPLLRLQRQTHRPGHRPGLAGWSRDLFVSDLNNGSSGDVAVFDNHNFTSDGTLSGSSSPDGSFVDAAHNLYVANFAAPAIQEYARGHTSPTFTYNSGLTDPVDVAADTAGNVYAANYNQGSNGAVVEYAQGSNTPINSCTMSGGVEGVAIDGAGDVFVDQGISFSTGSIVEFVGGLSGCNGTTLSISGLNFPGGMVIDKRDDLVVCDQNGAKVDVIPPPYTTITSTLGSGYTDPFHVTINRANKVAYVADFFGAAVDVLNYPSGSLIQQLGSANGLVAPTSAVDGTNAVY